MQPADVFISYAWGKEDVGGKQRQEVFERVYTALKSRGMRVVVDSDAIAYRESIQDYMLRLGQGSYIVLLLSDAYLRSQSCMFEASVMLQQPNFRQRIFPVVLDDARIFTAADRQQYYHFWDNAIAAQQTKYQRLPNKSYTGNLAAEIDKLSDIRRILDQFLSALSDMNTYGLRGANNYQLVIQALEQKMLADAGLNGPEHAFELLQLPPSVSPARLHKQYTQLQQQYSVAREEAAIDEVKQGYSAALQKLDLAYSIAKPLANKYFTAEKARLKRLLKAKKYFEAKILCEQLLDEVSEDAELKSLLYESENNLTLGDNGKEASKAATKTPKNSGKRESYTAKNPEAVHETATGETQKPASDSRRKMVSPKQMPKQMQMQVKDREEIRKQKIRRVLIPALFAIIAIIAGFVVKERILRQHVTQVIEKAREHVSMGELSTAVRLLEDASRDLVYEERLKQELYDFSVLKKQYDELVLKIRADRKQKKWKLAERAILRILDYTPRDSFMIYQLREVQKELANNDFSFWILIADDATKQGEAGYPRARDALLKAKSTGLKTKLVDESLRKIDSLSNLAFERRWAKIEILKRDRQKSADLRTECELALALKPNHAELTALLEKLNK